MKGTCRGSSLKTVSDLWSLTYQSIHVGGQTYISTVLKQICAEGYWFSPCTCDTTCDTTWTQVLWHTITARMSLYYRNYLCIRRRFKNHTQKSAASYTLVLDFSSSRTRNDKYIIATKGSKCFIIYSSFTCFVHFLRSRIKFVLCSI